MSVWMWNIPSEWSQGQEIPSHVANSSPCSQEKAVSHSGRLWVPVQSPAFSPLTSPQAAQSLAVR